MIGPFILTEASGIYIQKYWGYKFETYEQAHSAAWAYANQHQQAVYIWDKGLPYSHDEHAIAVIRPFLLSHVAPIYPLPLRVRHPFYLWANQNARPATILAILDDEALVEYEMPGGTTALRIVKVNSFRGKPGEQITDYGPTPSYKRVPKRWLIAMIENEVDWIGEPQGLDRGESIPTVAEMLRLREES